jgi:Enoyl-CoA hydratase/carnithine racemase
VGERVTVDRDGHVLIVGLHRPEKRNAADFTMLQELSLAYGELDRDERLRAAVVFGHGDHFTAGLDLADLGPRLTDGGLDFVPDGGLDPWGVRTSAVRKPVVLAVQGTCFTLGIELALASDVVVAADSTEFAQLEVQRGILPFGGATIRLPLAVGWGDAMRWMLTGDRFDAAEAHRIGLVQEVVPHGDQLPRAHELAHRIAAQAPLAVQATLANAREAIREGHAAAEQRLPRELVRLAATDDAAEGMRAFLARDEPRFSGR